MDALVRMWVWGLGARMGPAAFGREEGIVSRKKDHVGGIEVGTRNAG